MSINSASTSSSGGTPPLDESHEDLHAAENSLTRTPQVDVKPVKNTAKDGPPVKKIPLNSWKFTTRQKERIVFLPLMLSLLAASGLFAAVFETKCAHSLKIALAVQQNYMPFYYIRFCYACVFFYLLAASCSSLPVKKPNEMWSFNFAFGIVALWTITVFIGNHYNSEVLRLEQKRFSPLRQESFNRTLRKVYHGHGVYTTVKASNGKNETEVRPTPSKMFFKELNDWLDLVQPALNCCGIEGFEDYNIDLVRKFDNSTGVTALVQTEFPNSKRIQIGLREKHVLKSLDPDDAEVPDVRQSCCKVKTKKCNFNIFGTLPANKTNIHTDGCRDIILKAFKTCHTWFWLMANLPLFIGLPAMFIAFCYVRHAQGLSFSACRDLRRRRDPELEDEKPKPKPKAKDKEEAAPPRKSNGKVAPMEQESPEAVYNFIEHIKPGHVRKSHEARKLSNVKK